jgi:hypothetical protein
MKQLITTLSAAILIILLMPHAKADFSYSVQIDEVISKKSVTITYPETGDKYLLYLKTGCGIFQKGQSVSLIVNGSLDGGNDVIKEDSIHQCVIQQADVFTHKLYVNEVFGDNMNAYVTDEKNNKYYIVYGANCKSLGGYRNSYIYAFTANDALAKSDRILIPDNGGQCSITYLESVPSKENKNVTSVQDKAPTAVTGVKAFPGNSNVFLSWNASSDDKGIDHYVVSYSKYHLDTKGMKPGDMTAQLISKSSNLSVTGLENDELYYFYVIAVDTSGQTSSDWSEEVKTTPKSSIISSNNNSGSTSMNIRLALQNSVSYLIRWSPVSGARQTVIFEINGRRDFVITDFTGNRVTIVKRADMTGKTLTVRVRAYDVHGSMIEQKFDF